jgi:hypothetical protein
MTGIKNLILCIALAASSVSSACALDLPSLYKEAGSRWSLEQANRLPYALTPEVVKTMEQIYGAGPAVELAGKKEKVAALVKRYQTCRLTEEDLKTAEKYLAAKFRTEIFYSADHGCFAMEERSQEPAPPRSSNGRDRGAGTPKYVSKSLSKSSGNEVSETEASEVASASLARLQTFAAAGSINACHSGAEFFDGAKNGGRPVETLTASDRSASYPLARRTEAATKPLKSKVPPLKPAAAAPERPILTPMPDINEYGRVHQAAAYWGTMRGNNWQAYKNENLSGPERASALAKAGAAAGLGGLLNISNLIKVEASAARLGWAVGQDASAGTITADALKLTFHAGMFALALLPIPMLKAVKAARAGKAWGISIIAASVAGPANRYIFHIVD